MKRGTDLLLKFKKLKMQLRMPLWQVKGLLQSLWDFTAENALEGNIGRWTNEEIALGIEWEGDPDELIRVLVATRWVDAHPADRLVIHDWQEECEDYIKKRLTRKRQSVVDAGGQNLPPVTDGCLPIPSGPCLSGPGPGPDPCLNLSKEEDRAPAIADGSSSSNGKASRSSKPDREPEPDPLAGCKRLGKLYPMLCEELQKVHPKLRIPDAGSKQEHDWKTALLHLHTIDEYEEFEIVQIFIWLLSAETDENAKFWRQQVQGLGNLRVCKKGDATSKFDKIATLWKGSKDFYGMDASAQRYKEEQEAESCALIKSVMGEDEWKEIVDSVSVAPMPTREDARSTRAYTAS